eukprot:CAMPEP_0179099660 /NCGR_PEP_ID=MMETSP0796-20121207/45987_1 /TAXON_ID=73915 /ORGANISM="Pyrodinium bahamense, Strain pbaha01" /LENGTH=87 /DNA_ID=CAMNT_0020797463 /DNA_START=100 /DNA_END=359 /DNA_ORIENTATION=-
MQVLAQDAPTVHLQALRDLHDSAIEPREKATHQRAPQEGPQEQRPIEGEARADADGETRREVGDVHRRPHSAKGEEQRTAPPNARGG